MENIVGENKGVTNEVERKPESSIRRATVADLETIIRLNKDIFKDATERNNDLVSGFMETEDGKNTLGRELVDPNHAFFILEVDGKPAGYVDGLPKEFSYRKSKYWEIRTLGVIPEFRGKGFATDLLDLMEEDAKKRGYDKVYVEWYKENSSGVELYMQRDYVPLESIFVLDIGDRNGEVTDKVEHRPIRRATAADLDTIIDLNLKIFCDAEELDDDLVLEFMDTEDGRKTLEEELNDPECRFFILEVDGKPAGYVDGLPKEFQYRKSKYWEVRTLGVIPEFKGRGFATELLDLMEEDAIKRGYNKIYLECYEKNIPAVELYKKRKYKPGVGVYVKDLNGTKYVSQKAA